MTDCAADGAGLPSLTAALAGAILFALCLARPAAGKENRFPPPPPSASGPVARPLRPPATNGNGTASPLEVEEAIRGLQSPDWILQAQAIAVLARAKAPQAVAPLKAILAGQGHPWVRGRALVALAEILGPGAIEDAMPLAGHTSPELRVAAMEALGAAGSPRALAGVEAHLADPAPAVRYQAVVALARLQRQAAWPCVALLLGDADPTAVSHAARALVYVGTPAARKELVNLLGHASFGVRLAAAQAQREVRDPEAVPLLLRRMAGDSAAEVKAAADRALLAYDPKDLARPCLEALAPAEKSESTVTALYGAALRVLGARPSAEARDGLAALLRETPEKYRTVISTALDVLAGDDPTAYQDVFVRFLDHREITLRRKVIEIVSRCRGADLWSLLKPRLTDADEHAAVAAFKALRRAAQGEPPEGIVGYLAEAIQASNPDIAEEALALLGERLTAAEVPKALATLDPILAGANETQRRLAVAAFERFTDADLSRRIATAQGYLTQWTVIGPFPNDLDNRGLTAAYPPEFEADFTKACEAYPFGQGAAFKTATAAAAGDAAGRKPSLSIRPPEQDGVPGRTIVAYTLDLPPAANLKLQLAWGLQGDSPEGGDGVRFQAAVDGRPVLERKVTKADGWVAAQADLAPWAGKRVVLELTVDALEKAAGDWALVGEPQIVAGGAVAADLVKLAPSATARSLVGDSRLPRLMWEQTRVRRASGDVDLHEALTQEDFKVGYAAVDLDWPAEQKVSLAITGDDAAKAWLNGETLGERSGAGVLQPAVTLKKGRNRLLLKVCNQDGEWLFSVRLVDAQGRRIEVPKGP